MCCQACCFVIGCPENAKLQRGTGPRLNIVSGTAEGNAAARNVFVMNALLTRTRPTERYRHRPDHCRLRRRRRSSHSTSARSRCPHADSIPPARHHGREAMMDFSDGQAAQRVASWRCEHTLCTAAHASPLNRIRFYPINRSSGLKMPPKAALKGAPKRKKSVKR